MTRQPALVLAWPMRGVQSQREWSGLETSQGKPWKGRRVRQPGGMERSSTPVQNASAMCGFQLGGGLSQVGCWGLLLLWGAAGEDVAQKSARAFLLELEQPPPPALLRKVCAARPWSGQRQAKGP